MSELTPEVLASAWPKGANGAVFLLNTMVIDHKLMYWGVCDGSHISEFTLHVLPSAGPQGAQGTLVFNSVVISSLSFCTGPFNISQRVTLLNWFI